MIITIARQCGCGAIRVGKLLAEKYGIPFYTRKNLMEMAEQRGVLDEMEAFFDERPVDELLFSMSSLGETQRALTEKPLRTLADMIGDEDCIIIGRCGNYIFRERKDLISVFLSGNLEARIKGIQEEKGFSYEEAEELWSTPRIAEWLIISIIQTLPGEMPMITTSAWIRCAWA